MPLPDPNPSIEGVFLYDWVSDFNFLAIGGVFLLVASNDWVSDFNFLAIKTAFEISCSSFSLGLLSRGALPYSSMFNIIIVTLYY